MYQNYTIAGNGMKRMFEAEIIAILAAIVMVIPLLGTIVGLVGMLVGFVLSLMGLYAAGPAHSNFRTAFQITIANIILAFASMFVNSGAMGVLLSVVSTALSFLVTYFVCNAASELLATKGDGYQADRGQLIWKLYLACAAVKVICSILAVIPIIGALAAVLLFVARVVQLMAGVLYLIFLYNAYRSLLS